jgi:hypothetical protein
MSLMPVMLLVCWLDHAAGCESFQIEFTRNRNSTLSAL